MDDAWTKNRADALTAALTEDNFRCPCGRCRRYRPLIEAALNEAEQRGKALDEKEG